LKKRGWSVDRKRFTSEWKIRLHHSRWRARKPEIQKCFVIEADVGSIRGCVNSEKALFVVTDAALFTNPAHASVLLAENCTDSVARRARLQLMQALPKHIDVQEAFASVDGLGWVRGLIYEVRAILRQIPKTLLSRLLTVTK
jgi:hypothetical protein